MARVIEQRQAARRGALDARGRGRAARHARALGGAAPAPVGEASGHQGRDPSPLLSGRHAPAARRSPQSRAAGWRGRQGGAAGGGHSASFVRARAGRAAAAGDSSHRASRPTGCSRCPPARSSRRRPPSRGPAATPPREAQILLTLIHHPGLLARHVEDLAELELTSRDAARLRDALTHLAMDAHERPEGVRADLEAIGLSAELAAAGVGRRASRACWCVLPGAAEEDAGESLRQALALHRRARALHRELKSAETELGRDATEQNLDRLREIQSELAALEGREAAVEGFGLMSGRQTRAL